MFIAGWIVFFLLSFSCCYSYAPVHGIGSKVFEAGRENWYEGRTGLCGGLCLVGAFRGLQTSLRIGDADFGEISDNGGKLRGLTGSRRQQDNPRNAPDPGWRQS
jgi:hypothetical protein